MNEPTSPELDVVDLSGLPEDRRTVAAPRSRAASAC
jgi:hypothetical protein